MLLEKKQRSQVRICECYGGGQRERTLGVLTDLFTSSQFFVLAGSNSQTAKVPKELNKFVKLTIIPDDMKEFHTGLE